jgi:hypothetical protein
MKNTIKFLGIAALIAIIGFSMTACSGDGNSGDNNNSGAAGILTFTDELPDLAGTYYDYLNVFIIANGTSESNIPNAPIIAHMNSYFDDFFDETNKTITLRVPARSLTVSNNSDISSSDKIWTGSGTYTIYVSHSVYTDNTKILKDVIFSNGSATVAWSSFQ